MYCASHIFIDSTALTIVNGLSPFINAVYNFCYVLSFSVHLCPQVYVSFLSTSVIRASTSHILA